jgi:CheY-like chemotaxis protein
MKNKLDNILLIDDDMTVNFLHSHMIESEKIANSLSIAETGELALKIVAKETPDLILLDLNMPKMDGWEFLKEYKKMIPASKRSPIVILSSSANPDDKQRADSSAEISGFYNKPLTKKALLQIFNLARNPNNK